MFGWAVMGWEGLYQWAFCFIIIIVFAVDRYIYNKRVVCAHQFDPCVCVCV